MESPLLFTQVKLICSKWSVTKRRVIKVLFIIVISREILNTVIIPNTNTHRPRFLHWQPFSLFYINIYMLPRFNYILQLCIKSLWDSNKTVYRKTSGSGGARNVLLQNMTIGCKVFSIYNSSFFSNCSSCSSVTHRWVLFSLPVGLSWLNWMMWMQHISCSAHDDSAHALKWRLICSLCTAVRQLQGITMHIQYLVDAATGRKTEGLMLYTANL